MGTIIVVIIILVILYAFIGTVKLIYNYSQAYIPIKTVNCSISNIQLSTDKVLNTNGCTNADQDFKIDVSFPIYIIGFMSFISWFLFVLFGGIGLAALPLDLIYDFCTRPKKLSTSEMESQKKKIINESMRLKEIAAETKHLEEKGAKKSNSNILFFKN